MQAANINAIRKPFEPRQYPSLKKALDFMNANGHRCYSQEINELQAHFEEIQAEAGPGGLNCILTQDLLDRIDEEIEAVAEAAVDRINDWATD
jgi:hypothetical protein